MNKKSFWLVIIIFLSILGGLLLGNLLSGRAKESIGNMFGNRGVHGKVDELLSIIDAQYVDTVNTTEMTEEMTTDKVFFAKSLQKD